MTFQITQQDTKHAGGHQARHALESTINDMGVDLNEGAFDEAYTKVTETADAVGVVSPRQIRAIVDDIVCRSLMMRDLVEAYR